MTWRYRWSSCQPDTATVITGEFKTEKYILITRHKIGDSEAPDEWWVFKLWAVWSEKRQIESIAGCFALLQWNTRRIRSVLCKTYHCNDMIMCEISGSYGALLWPAKKRWTTANEHNACEKRISLIDGGAERICKEDVRLEKGDLVGLSKVNGLWSLCQFENHFWNMLG